MPVHAIAARFSISRPAVSRHLRVLKQAGLVSEQSRGRENVYMLERARIEALNRWLMRFWDSRLSSLKQIVEARMDEDEKQ